jgi:hypothetical protein
MEYRDLLGKSFSHGGRGQHGYDCYGLVMELYSRLGRSLPDMFSNSADVDVLSSGYLSVLPKLNRLSAPEEWAIVAFKMNMKHVTHCGVVLPGCRTFIHIMPKSNVCIQPLGSPLWERLVAGYFTCQ